MRTVETWKGMFATLVPYILAAGFLEPFLFIAGGFYQFIDFAAFFFPGYLYVHRTVQILKFADYCRCMDFGNTVFRFGLKTTLVGIV